MNRITLGLALQPVEIETRYLQFLQFFCLMQYAQSTPTSFHQVGPNFTCIILYEQSG